ncbi:helix-turn-helix transcriptional regulator [Amycolatopsis sp. cmx-11-51]|uniref:helix-turn-helix transcriptional regulator n=1 Tax=unclassified Amycolatopsis TaxID=2618356 RepID=UPI0039E54F52
MTQKLVADRCRSDENTNTTDADSEGVLRTDVPADPLIEHAVRCAEQAIAAVSELLGVLEMLAGTERESQHSVPERRRPPATGIHLTNQERRVLTMLAAGLPNRKIAVNLDISDKTVKNYVHSLLVKLDVTSRTEAASKAFGERLVDPVVCRSIRTRNIAGGDLVPAPRHGGTNSFDRPR